MGHHRLWQFVAEVGAAEDVGRHCCGHSTLLVEDEPSLVPSVLKDSRCWWLGALELARPDWFDEERLGFGASEGFDLPLVVSSPTTNLLVSCGNSAPRSWCPCRSWEHSSLPQVWLKELLLHNWRFLDWSLLLLLSECSPSPESASLGCCLVVLTNGFLVYEQVCLGLLSWPRGIGKSELRSGHSLELFKPGSWSTVSLSGTL